MSPTPSPSSSPSGALAIGSHAEEATPFGLWGRAFRPLFLGAAVHAPLALLWWVAAWGGAAAAPAWLAPPWWHGHEMLFGLVAAAIGGFLLTASPVWTGGPALTGRPLAALVGLWVAGRIALAAAGTLPAGLVAALDLAFLPAVAVAVLRTLWGSGQTRNHAVVGIVALLAAANAAMHAEALGLVHGVARPALRFAVDVVVVLVLVIAGRITPVFTRNALRRRALDRTVRSPAAVGAVAIASAAALAALTPLTGRTAATGALALVAGLATALRLAGWQSWHTRRDPLLWSLHAGSAWLAAGLLLVAAGDLGAPVPEAAGLHALTAGAMGATLLAVMTRVGVAHTGRPLALPAGAVGCYALVHAGALLRVAATFLAPEGQRLLVPVAGLAWAGAFALFAIRYAPILVRPRVDGRPG